MDIRSVAIDPNNSSTYYIGRTSGLYKSTNSGSSWNKVYASSTWRKIMVNPANSDILLGATSSGLVRSSNGGSSWTTVESGSFTDIEFKPNAPATVYACSNGTVYYSTNSGTSFSSSSGTSGSNSRLAVTDADPNYVYFINSNEAVYRSTNSGTSFSQRNAGSNDVFGGLAWYGMGFACSNSNKDVIYAGGFELYKSTNGGTSFTKHVAWTWNNSTGRYIHADMHAMENVGP